MCVCAHFIVYSVQTSAVEELLPALLLTRAHVCVCCAFVVVVVLVFTLLLCAF